MFVDRVKIKVKSGDGGNGIVAFRREKYVPLGGPSGGDGGNGGSIVFVTDTNRSTLLDLRYNKLIVAKNGENGKTKKMHGANGVDFIVKVPVGTIVKNADNNQVLVDLSLVNQEFVIAKGGKGGKGNFHFASSRNNAPDFAQLGEIGISLNLELELKLLADVGLVGFPSVGKSTLLSVVSNAKAEIGDYHFTTLKPNLGVINTKDKRSFVMADLPGLIKGASLGKGLGIQFLRHIERCRIILHVIDMSGSEGRNPIEDYQVINEELKTYQYRLIERPMVVLANKMDIDGADKNLIEFKKKYKDVIVFEAITLINQGLDKLIYYLMDLLEKTPMFYLTQEIDDGGIIFKYQQQEEEFEIINEGNGRWRIESKKIEKLLNITNIDKYDGAIYFASQLRKMGVEKALREKGCLSSDIVYINDYGFSLED